MDGTSAPKMVAVCSRNLLLLHAPLNIGVNLLKKLVVLTSEHEQRRLPSVHH
jgi:hypothetical protein